MTYRVAIIAGQLVIGGAERQLMLWLSHMNREKFQPVVVTLHPNCGDYWEGAIESLNIPLLHVPRYRSRVVRALKIIQILKPYNPQLIHGWHLFASPYAGVAAKFFGAKSLGALRDSFRVFQKSFPEADFTFYLTDAILANSHVAAEKLSIAKKRKQQEIFSIPNAVEQQNMDRSVTRKEISRRFGVSLDDVWIGSLGRLDPKKHFEFLLQAIASLQEHATNVHLLLIGDGVERLKLEEMASSLGISDRVIFAGEIPNASAWLCALDIFCFTSLDEGLPNAVMEAAIAGVPVVAWRMPFFEELLEHEKTALLVEPEDSTGLIDALLSLVRMPELRMQLGDAARQHMMQEFNLDLYVSRISSLYEHLLNGDKNSNFEQR